MWNLNTFDKKITYSWANQTKFSGQYFSVCEEKKAWKKRRVSRHYANIQKYRYINQRKIKNNLFIGYVTCTYISYALLFLTYTLRACLGTCT